MDARLTSSERRRRDRDGQRRALKAFKRRVDDLDISSASKVLVMRALQEEIDKLDD